MGKVLMCGTSGGVTSDDITAKREDIIAGKTAITADSDDEIVEGTLPEHKSDVVTQASGMSGNNYQMQFAKGAYRRTDLSNGSGGRVTVGLPTLRSNIGYTNPAKVLNDTTIAGQTGTIPIQGGSTIVPGTANKTAISGGRYASGNILVSGDPNLVAGNIKKGVRIFGVTGTHDGFVPGPYDIYNRGSWGSGYGQASIVATNSSSTHTYYPTHIESWGPVVNSRRRAPSVTITKNGSPINLQPYKTVNLVYTTDCGPEDMGMTSRLELDSNSNIYTNTPFSTTERTVTLNISNVNVTDKIIFRNISDTDVSGMGDKFNIYRIYFT